MATTELQKTINSPCVYCLLLLLDRNIDRSHHICAPWSRRPLWFVFIARTGCVICSLCLQSAQTKRPVTKSSLPPTYTAPMAILTSSHERVRWPHYCEWNTNWYQISGNIEVQPAYAQGGVLFPSIMPNAMIMKNALKSNKHSSFPFKIWYTMHLSKICNINWYIIDNCKRTYLPLLLKEFMLPSSKHLRQNYLYAREKKVHNKSPLR